MFNKDGSLNYTYENVSVNSLDDRRKGQRDVKYTFKCSKYNDGGFCKYLMTFPARVNLGQLAFILPSPVKIPAGASFFQN